MNLQLKFENAYFAGNFEECFGLWEEFSSVIEVEDEREECFSFAFRSMIELGNVAMNSSQISNAQLAAALCLYERTWPNRNNATRSTIMDSTDIDQILSISNNISPATSTILAILHGWTANKRDSYKWAVKSATIEGQLIAVLILCHLKRFDLVELQMQRLSKIKDINEHVSYHLIQSEISIEKGGRANLTDAKEIIGKLISDNGKGIKLLNRLLSIQMLLYLFNDADSTIETILGKDPSNPHALSILVSLSVLRGLGAHVIADQLGRLAASDSNAPFLMMLEERASQFETL